MRGEEMEGIPLRAEPFKGGGKRFPETRKALQGVMKHYYGAIASIPFHIFHYLLGREVLTVVAGHEVIHHDLVMFFQSHELPRTKPAVGRTEEVGAGEACPLRRIAHIAHCRGGSSLDMMEGVVAYGVSALPHFFKESRVALHILTNHKEGGLYPETVENVEHPWGSFGNRTVVEGDEDPLLLPLCLGDTEDGPGEKPPEPSWRTFYEHIIY